MMIMSESFSVSVHLPLDSDDFLRRECPSCEREFKWFSHDEHDPNVERVGQYFCPLCGVPAGVDQWWTPAQAEYANAAALASPAAAQHIQDIVEDAFKGLTRFKRSSDFDLDVESPEPPYEPDDMVIVEPPCHPNEPLKVPETATGGVHCLVCGARFAV